MSITDELRKWAEDNTLQDTVLTTYPPQHAVHGVLETLLRIADRIDAEHERLMQEQPFTIDMVPMTDESMAEHGWIRLPVDADGEYIHIGDMMESEGSDFLFDEASFEVRSMRCNECGWEVYDRLGDRYAPSLLCHHHAPTVEDVLREFALAVCKDDALTIREGVVEKYAAKLRLADGEDA